LDNEVFYSINVVHIRLSSQCQTVPPTKQDAASVTYLQSPNEHSDFGRISRTKIYTRTQLDNQSRNK